MNLTDLILNEAEGDDYWGPYIKPKDLIQALDDELKRLNESNEGHGCGDLDCSNCVGCEEMGQIDILTKMKNQLEAKQ